MDSRVIRRLLTGVGANVYNQTVTATVQLIGVPILIHAWGTQLYGEWLILFAVPAYLSMTDLGLSQSAGNDMTALVARGERGTALVLFQSLTTLIFLIAGSGLVIITLLLWWAPIGRWLPFSAIDSHDARWILWLLAAEVFVRLPDGANHAGYRACNDYALHIGLNSTTRLVQFAGVWTAALAGGGPVASAGAFFGVRALATSTFSALLVHRHRWLRFAVLKPRRKLFGHLIKPALANVAMPLAQMVNVQGMVLVVGGVLGPFAVVVFTTLRTLTRLSFQLVLAVSNATEPELAVAWGASDRRLMKSLFVHSLRAGLWLAIGAAVGLASLGNVILNVWTRGAVPMNNSLFDWLLFSAVASVLWYTALIVLRATNRHLHVASAFVIISAVSLGAGGLLLAKTHDIANAGLALLIMDAAMTFYALRGAANLLGFNAMNGLIAAANPLPILSVLRRKLLGRAGS